VADSITVLYVGNADTAEQAVSLFEQSETDFSVATTERADEGADKLAEASFDAVVSEYDLTDKDGIAFLESVREIDADVPFVLYTDAGSEAVASEAISAGVTEYVRRTAETGDDGGIVDTVEAVVDRSRNCDPLRAYLERSTDIITVLDSAGTITYLSPSVEQVLGYEQGALVGESGFEYVHPDDVDAVSAAFSEIASDPEGRLSVECRFRTADDEWCWLEVNGRNYLDHPAIQGVVANTRDITQRKEQRRQLQTLISNLPGIIYRSQIDREWSMVSVEGECEALTGYPASALENGDVVWGEDILHPADRTEIWQTVHDELEADGTFEVTYRIRTADGETKWMWERGRLVDTELEDEPILEGFITDIDDRKRSKQKLEETNALLSTLFEALPVGVLAENASRDVLAANDRFLELFEQSGIGETIEGADCERLLREASDNFADSEEFVERTNDLIETSEPVRDNELRLRDGRTFARSHQPIDLPSSEGHLWLYRDVSEQERRERELERQNERLDEFASVVSHDLRNPLQVLRGSLDALTETGEQAALDRGYHALDRMEALIDDLLALARNDESVQTTESVSLASLADQCWDVVQTADAELVVDDHCSIEANPERLRQLLENLMRNAIEHGGENVTVTIGALDDGFYVEDTGPGIPPDVRERVFEPGYSESDGGTGFGLAIVEQVADAHDWTVRLTEGERGGARFEIVDAEQVGG